MKFARRRRGTDLTVELTPLIDVVFLLLIFFMVSANFVRETQLRLDLPRADGAAQVYEPGDVVATVSAAGAYAIDGATVEGTGFEAVRAALDAATRDRGVSRVVIAADAGAQHQSVVRLLDAAGQLGLDRISITTRPSEP